MDTNSINELWRQITPKLKQEYIVADREFYCDAADKFTIKLVEDDTDKHELPFETILPTHFVYIIGATYSDLVGFFLHVASHQRCDLFWQRCPVPMEQFSAIQLDLIEEVYNQRLVSVVAPDYYEAFPTINALYDVYKGFNVAKRKPLQTMFTKVCDTGIVTFDAVHEWLYRSDPLQQATFNNYMQVWSILLAKQELAAVITEYEND
jgi:hypothetical protein